jgi:outer membrane protein OmpA-like peptidoglycan-associated protein
MNRLLFLGLVELALLCVLCLYCRAPAIEEDLRGMALACLADAGLDGELLTVSGRDATLTGSVASPVLGDDAEACIAAIPGIRVVNNSLEIAGPGRLGFRTHYGGVTLWGTVPTEEAHSALLDEAVALWGSDNVIDELEVDLNRTFEVWPDSFDPALAGLHHYRKDLEVELSGGRVAITGTVVSELTKSRILGGAATVFPGFEIVDRLTVREPVDQREILQSSLDTLLQAEYVEFATDSAELTAEGRRVLEMVVEILKAAPGRVEISGHTDSRQTLEYNLELSTRRAESVRDYFVGAGLDPDRFEVMGYGPTRPIASNATPEGQQLNRRTEFHALKEN